MFLVKGKFENGAAYPNQPIQGREGQSVVIMFVELDNNNLQPNDDISSYNRAWDEFYKLIERCATDTGIEDLAHQHGY